jgi:serine protease Do
MEKVLIDVIARGEKSVVAVAIFRVDGLADTQRILGQQRFRVKDGKSVPPLDAIPDSYATGVVVDAAGLILTNQHVLRGKAEDMRIFIRLAGHPLWEEVRVKATDPYIDLAILEVATPGAEKPSAEKLKWQPIVFGDASRLRKGQIVITLGNPYAIARDGQVSAGWGIVSNTGRRLPSRPGKPAATSRPTMHHLGTLIQTDAKLNLGTSGGPLLNLRGEMVGLNTSLAAVSGYEQSAGYSIAVDKFFKRAVKLLMEGREVEYGFLGIRPRQLREPERRAGDRGVRVDLVIGGSPAAGLLRSRDVITHIEGEQIITVEDLMRSIGRQPAHSHLDLIVRRADREMRVPVKLTKNRLSDEKIVTNRPAGWRGLRVEYPAAVRSLGHATRIPTRCVIVSEVAAESPAAIAGLLEGMQIRRVDGVAVSTPEEFSRAVEKKVGPVRIDLRAATADEPASILVSEELQQGGS